LFTVWRKRLFRWADASSADSVLPTLDARLLPENTDPMLFFDLREFRSAVEAFTVEVGDKVLDGGSTETADSALSSGGPSVGVAVEGAEGSGDTVTVGVASGLLVSAIV
jgi:hypothetical protein